MNRLSGLLLMIAATLEGAHILAGATWNGMTVRANLFMMLGAPWIFWAGLVLYLARNPNRSYVWIGSAIIILFAWGIFISLGRNDMGWVYVGTAAAVSILQSARLHFQTDSAISRNYPGGAEAPSY